MSPVAFVTYQHSPEMTDDDRLAAEILKSQGLAVHSLAWNAPGINWSEFSCVVIRSAWDYHLQADLYARWLRRCSAEGVRLWNPPAAVLANLNKRYLLELGRQGITVVPTVYLPASAERQLREVLVSSHLDQVVIKPAVSASAGGTWRSSLAAAEADQQRFAEQIRGQDLLVQPYLSEIERSGEWSLVFFGGAYSHAVLKTPVLGDFRVQREFGGQAVPATPSHRSIEQALSVLARLDSPLLYARVDGVEQNGHFVVMELEINEPFLFLGCSPQAAARFAQAIVDLV